MHAHYPQQLGLIFWLMWLLLSPAMGAEPVLLSLDTAVTEAVTNNPSLAEMQARAEALADIPSQVGTLPDPILQLNVLNLPVDTFNTGQEPMTQLQIGISQALPFPGKLGLRQDAARFEAEAASSNVDEVRLRLIRDVKSTWWRLFYSDRALETVAKNQGLLRQLVTIASTKYQVGKGLQQDVLLAQLELSKLLDVQLQLENMRRTQEARLNTLLDEPRDRALRLPQYFNPARPQVPSDAELYDIAESNRPLLSAQQSRIDASRARLDLARKDLYPDFTLGALYGQRDSVTDFASVRLSVVVPLYAGSKQYKAIDQRNRERLGQQYGLLDQRGRVQAEIAAARADYVRAREQVILFDTGILPQARQTVDSMRAGYQTNEVDFLNLVRAQVTLYNYEDRYWKAISDANGALARLTAAVGREVHHE
ncbi:MAG: TolC family protein [Gammaproteobacteria bacterium]